jgi:hypothetical protein
MDESQIRIINREFLQAAISRQIMRCITKERYRVGLFSFSVKRYTVECILERISDELRINNHIERFRVSPTDLEIKFKNGSRFKFLPASESARGNKFNDIIVDSSVDIDIKDNICRPCLIPYYPDINGLKNEKTIYLECEI